MATLRFNKHNWEIVPKQAVENSKIFTQMTKAFDELGPKIKFSNEHGIMHCWKNSDLNMILVYKKENGIPQNHIAILL